MSQPDDFAAWIEALRAAGAAASTPEQRERFARELEAGLRASARQNAEHNQSLAEWLGETTTVEDPNPFTGWSQSEIDQWFADAARALRETWKLIGSADGGRESGE